MAAQWIEYTGRDEQIDKLEESLEGYVLLLEAVSGTHQTEILYRDEWAQFDSERIIEYLICDPHPYADMICQWARTGQPVWVRYAKVCHFGQTSEYEICNQIATLTTDWNIPGAEYSFTPFEGEV